MSLKSELEKILGEFDDYGQYLTAQAILDLLDKSLPKELNSFPNERDVDEMAGYNAALADVRKVIKEV